MKQMSIETNNKHVAALNLAEILDTFLHNVESLNSTTPFLMMGLGELAKRKFSQRREFLEKHGTLEHSGDGQSTYTLPPRFIPEEKKKTRELEQIFTAVTLFPRNFLVSFVSEYDAFLGALIKCFYVKKSELLNGLEKQISFSELLAYQTLDDAKNYLLEKEVESILRKSHAEHFEILERKFNIKLKKDLDIWPHFIELMERRNLFVHCDGVVSSQYITVCTEHGVNFNSPLAVGTKLEVDPEYLHNAFTALCEIAIKLCHVLWRKVFPEEREAADQALLNLTFELIQRGRHKLTITIAEFATKLPKHFDDTYKRKFVINLAQAYKYTGETKKCSELLASHDWSSITYEFKLAVSVLRDDFVAAAAHMEKATSTGEISEHNLLEWRIFQDFRETEQFKETFTKIFKHPPPEKEAVTIRSSEEGSPKRVRRTTKLKVGASESPAPSKGKKRTTTAKVVDLESAARQSNSVAN